MRKGLRIVFILVFLGQGLPAAHASCYPAQKLQRGLVNIVTAPVEIPREIRAHWIQGSEKTFHIIVWILCGAIKGTFLATVRAGSGAWDVVSSPVRLPADGEPLLKPAYVFQDWPRRTPGVIYKNIGER